MLIVLGLLLIGVIMVAALGVGPLALREHGEGDADVGSSGAPLALVIGGAVTVLVVGLAVLLLVGIGRDGRGTDTSEERVPRARGAQPSEVAPTRAALDTDAVGRADDEAPGTGDDVPPSRTRPTLGPVVPVSAELDDEEAFPSPSRAVGALQPATVLRMRVDGFEPFTRARARQCAATASGPTRCGNTIGVQFDEVGRAAFQYFVVDDFVEDATAGRCRAGGVVCSIVVEAIEGDGRAELRTVFVDELPPQGRVRVTPRTGLGREGDVVTVEVREFPPGARVEAVVCAAPAVSGPRRCGSPEGTASLLVGRDGSGSTELAVTAGPIGTEGAVCRGGQMCGVSVVSGGAPVRAPVVPITFAGPAGAHYNPRTLGAGLAIAAALLGMGTWLTRRTDWSPVGEEAAPEIDEAEYADLDALAESFPPQPDLDELLASQRRE